MVGTERRALDAHERALAAAGSRKRRDRRPRPVRVADVRLPVHAVHVERVRDRVHEQRRRAVHRRPDGRVQRDVPVHRRLSLVLDVRACVPAAAVRHDRIRRRLVVARVRQRRRPFAPRNRARSNVSHHKPGQRRRIERESQRLIGRAGRRRARCRRGGRRRRSSARGGRCAGTVGCPSVAGGVVGAEDPPPQPPSSAAPPAISSARRLNRRRSSPLVSRCTSSNTSLLPVSAPAWHKVAHRRRPLQVHHARRVKANDGPARRA